MLCGEMKSIPDNVFILNKYCIENYFICQEAIKKIIAETEADHEPDDVVKTINFPQWLREMERSLSDLFAWYAVHRYFEGSKKTTSINAIAFWDSSNKKISEDRIKAKIEEIKNELYEMRTRDEIDRKLRRVRANIKKYAHDAGYISGKTYLMPLLARRLSDLSSFTDRDGLPMRLVHHCRVEPAEDLRDAISRAWSV